MIPEFFYNILAFPLAFPVRALAFPHHILGTEKYEFFYFGFYRGTYQVLGGFGVAVISTSKGVMTDKEAREGGHGGEVLCTVS